jgi:hypothetical protein
MSTETLSDREWQASAEGIDLLVSCIYSASLHYRRATGE